MYRYPRLYLNAKLRQATLSELGKWIQNRWEWIIEWRCDWFGWEKSQIIELRQHLTQNTLNFQNEDEWLWKDEEIEQYSIKSTYKKLQNTFKTEDLELYSLLWKVKALLSAQHFTWRVFLDRIATKENLRKRRVMLESYLCPMCGSMEESTNHPFFTCKITGIV